ncbi:Hsp20/alpha crystallin family protein [Herbaspirillum sp. RTI4]|uniref:Hsp20/alpha crystallin family protein n=1 Tax=Herbaspirillum sp. RTI4 TaxID=3048640 RepID=UPI002AB59319|nr:Hsp20/alpha crystallin family protein [Herbaspirillum sp. RTI4]MDY7578661.1 Hsp20/alpha crystallin family protein [Herbaspirillum sp. RTI4]MEA9980641.1 Hsp20/alpha crystallin family protein [Herbaspirillum sp. RTI4]
MTTISLYDPLTRRFNKFFHQVFLSPASMDTSNEGLDRLQLKLDVSEDAENYSVRADLPGVKKEDIRIDIDGNQITISAEVKKVKEEKGDGNLIYSERYEGKVFRSFTLDSSVDESKAEAKYADGVLKLCLPKKNSEQSRKRLSIQ